MALFFLRQIFIMKQVNKINYAPLIIAIGTISSLIHFMINPQIEDIQLLVRESLFPLIVSLLLFIIMYILHQTQQSENARTQDVFTKVLVSQITQLKEFMSDLESRMTLFAQEDRAAQEDVREKFKKDINALDAIQINQGKFLEKFDEMGALHKNISNAFEYFSTVQLPGLDDVVHKHIDILRIAEQDHYNQLKSILENAVQSRGDMSEGLDELKFNIKSMRSISDTIASDVTKLTLEQLTVVTDDFNKQIISLKSHAEAVRTSLYEGESRLGSIRGESELLMKQMVLSSKKMNEIESQNDGLYNLYKVIKELMQDIEVIKSDYVKSQSQLSLIAKELKSSEEEQILSMKKQIDSLGEDLSKRIDDSLEKLHEHYHIATEDITQSVKILAKKAQLKNGYNT